MEAHKRAMEEREAAAGADESLLGGMTPWETRNDSKNKRGRLDKGGNEGENEVDYDEGASMDEAPPSRVNSLLAPGDVCRRCGKNVENGIV